MQHFLDGTATRPNTADDRVVRYASIMVPVAQSSSHLCFMLGEDATRIAITPNAGGKSMVSEALSMEILKRSLNARSVVTEMEVVYWSSNWKKVDYICTVMGSRVGVSVTRAMKYPNPSEFTEEDAERLIHKKLYGLVIARDGIVESQRYERAMLHVWCQTARIAQMVEATFMVTSKAMGVQDCVALYTTVADNADFLFIEDDVNVLRTMK